MKKCKTRTKLLLAGGILILAALAAALAAVCSMTGGSSAVQLWSADLPDASSESGEIDAARQEAQVSFFNATVPAVLSGETKENAVYSPVALYLSLAQLAETADGEEQAELLALLGAENMEELRESAAQLLALHTVETDGIRESVISSLWMDESGAVDASAAELLAAQYAVFGFQAKLGSVKTNRSVQSWLNAQTGDLLGEKTGILLNKSDSLSSVSTVVFRAQWYDTLQESEAKSFYASSGKQRCAFLEGTVSAFVFEWDSFSAIALSLPNHYLLLVLPDEDSSVDTLFLSGEMEEFLGNIWNWDKCRSVTANLQIPEFSLTCAAELGTKLDSLGESLPQGSGLYQVQRFAVSADGILPETQDEISVQGRTQEKIDFTVDRPFAFFVINDYSGMEDQIVLAGIVNRVE